MYGCNYFFLKTSNQPLIYWYITIVVIDDFFAKNRRTLKCAQILITALSADVKMIICQLLLGCHETKKSFKNTGAGGPRYPRVCYSSIHNLGFVHNIRNPRQFPSFICGLFLLQKGHNKYNTAVYCCPVFRHSCDIHWILFPEHLEEGEESEHEHGFLSGKRVSDLMHMAHGIIMKNKNPRNETVSTI